MTNFLKVSLVIMHLHTGLSKISSEQKMWVAVTTPLDKMSSGFASPFKGFGLNPSAYKYSNWFAINALRGDTTRTPRLSGTYSNMYNHAPLAGLDK